MISAHPLRCALALGIAAGGISLSPHAAAAASLNATVAVTATVQATCNFTAANLDFGVYAGAQKDTTSTVAVTCTNGTTFNVGLLPGAGVGATVANRVMTGTGGTANTYALYMDSERSHPWGMTVGSDTVAGTGNGNAQAFTVYGRMRAGQFVTPGTYNDTITATVSY